MNPNEIIETKFGPMERKHLRRKFSVTNNDREYTEVTEYFLGDECVHRSATINLKKGLGIEGMLGQLR